MTTYSLPSAKSLQEKKNVLNPTTTIVRSLPIITEGWEEAALYGDTFSSNEMEDTDANREAVKAFQKALILQKQKLHSAKVVERRNIVVVSFTEDSQEDKRQPILGCLEPERGWPEAHGFRGESSWELPRQVVYCEAQARPGYASKLAHEYQDTPAVLKAKVHALARMMESSQCCLVYSGAGISTNSGIKDYATRTGTDRNHPKLRSPFEAQPTFSHRALVALHDANFIKYWIQQNHDGLPQKAGLPQRAINEIHGAWYDPSNPVVAMNGNLRSDLFQEMLDWEHRTDLTLSLGTSMCGMNSDRVFTTVARKGKLSFEGNRSNRGIIGGVIINRQQTQYDHISCLRIFADLDEVMALLLGSLGLKKRAEECIAAMSRGHIDRANCIANDDIFQVPYKSDGTRHSIPGQFSILDLRQGSKVRITRGPYQGDCGEVLGKNREGHYRIQFHHLVGITKRPLTSVLGSWWTEAARQGDVDMIPIVNIL